MWNLMTLDGYFEGAKGWDLDWHGFVWGDELERLSLEQASASDTLLFGRATYEGMAAYWSTATGEIADYMNKVRKIVFSRTLQSADWNNTSIEKAPPEEAVPRLKRESGKDLLVFGSAQLCATLMRHGLIDEYRIGLAPLVLGAGKPLFKPGPRVKMKLLDARPTTTGCVILRYAPAS
jgi:dihydrofolate reductase